MSVGTRNAAVAFPPGVPARGTTRIVFVLPADAETRLRVVDVQGRVVANLADGRLAAGPHALEWRADVRPGLYFVRLDADGRRVTRSVVIVR